MRAGQLTAFLALILLPLGSVAVAQDTEGMRLSMAATELHSELPTVDTAFVVLRPVPDLLVGLDTAQAVVVLWRERGLAAAARRVDFETTFGDLSAVRAETDAFGIALVFLSSSEPGAATITARGGGQAAQVSVRFVRSPTREETYRSAGRDIPLTVFQDRIGIQARSGVSAGQIFRIAQIESLQMRQTFGTGLYELDLERGYTLDSLHRLARQLESDYEEIFRAGIVVRSGPEKAPMLLTGQLVTGFEEPPNDAQARTIRDEFFLQSLEPVADGAAVYLATVKPEYQWDIFGIANRLVEWRDPRVRFAHPDFVVRTVARQGGAASAHVVCVGGYPDPPTADLYYCQQWHHENRGMENGVIDADIDSPEAWAITMGAMRRPRVAITDSAFLASHPDLAPNLWHDADGTPGHSFYDSDTKALLNDPDWPNPHGTSVAGILGAAAGKGYVGRGVCPGCEMLLIRNGVSAADIAKTFYFATEQDAGVISNSWGPLEPLDAVVVAIEQAAVDHDTPIVFASASAESLDLCDDPMELSSIDAHVIAVSSSTYLDDRTPSGYGDCIDVLAPSRRLNYNGIVTTSVRAGPKAEVRTNFGGTSAATPMVSGTIGLMLDVSPNLSRIEIQRILQDTTDRIDPAAGAYDPETGFSRPNSGPATHAYGRINAFEAVSLVAPFDADAAYPAKRGRGGMDLILRDHALDWGNTERPSCELFTPGNPRAHTSVIRSVDIKLDAEPFQQVQQTPQGFLNLVGEEPVPGKAAKVYIRVRNRGPATVPHAWVKLHWTLAFPLPNLQQDFWTELPGHASNTGNPQAWNPLREQEIEAIPYSGSSAAGCPGRAAPDCLPIGTVVRDDARIVVFDLVPPAGNVSGGGRLSLLAVVHSDNDPALPKLAVAPPLNFNDPRTATVWDNNVALWVADPGGGASWCPF